jgi:hypothetical protein
MKALKRFFRWLLPSNLKVGGGITDTPNGTNKEGRVEAEWRLK